MKVIYIAGPFRGENAWAVEQNTGAPAACVETEERGE